MGVIIQPQFIRRGVPLFKRASVPAMDPRCCCGPPFTTTCQRDYFHQDADAVPGVPFHFRDLQLWFNNRGNLNSWPPNNPDPLLDYWWTIGGIHGSVENPWQGTGFTAPGSQTVEYTSQPPDFPIIRAGTQGFRFGNDIGSSVIGARLKHTVSLMSTSTIPPMVSTVAFVYPSATSGISIDEYTVSELRYSAPGFPDEVRIHGPGLATLSVAHSNTLTMELEESTLRLADDEIEYHIKVTAMGIVIRDETTRGPITPGQPLNMCSKEVATSAFPFIGDFFSPYEGTFNVTSTVRVTYDNIA